MLELQIAYSQAAQAENVPDLIIFNGHFHAKVLGDDADRRLAEALTSVAFLEERGQEYPQSLIVMGGDFNDYPGSDTLDAFENSDYLLRVASDLPKDEQCTYYYLKKYEALDHLFVVLNNGGYYVPKSAKVHSKNGYAGSDHGALTAEFVIEPVAD